MTAPTVRDDLYRAVTAPLGGSILYTREDLPGDRGRRWRSCTWDVVDAVLEWLGGLDPDCDPALLAHHLHTSRAEIARLRSLLAELTDPGDCWYDHDGFCQAHALHQAPCPHSVARRLLSGDTEGMERPHPQESDGS